MENKVKNILKYLVSVALAVLLLTVCFRGIDWKDFLKALSSCDWRWIAVSMLAGALAFLLRGLRWRMLLSPIDGSISWKVCFNAVNISYAANMVFPRLGELLRCGYITGASEQGPDGKKLASYGKVLGTVVLERSADVLTLAAVLFLTMALTWKRFGGFFSESILGAMADRGIPWMIPVLGAVAVSAIASICLRRNASPVFSGVFRFISGIWQGAAGCVRMKRGWLFFVLTAGIWLCYLMTAATVIRSLRGCALDGCEIIASMDMTDALFLMLVGSVSSLVPVPGGFGAYHYLLTLALSSVYGIPAATGLAFATLSHESQAVTQIAFGTASYICETYGKTRRTKLRDTIAC